MSHLPLVICLILFPTVSFQFSIDQPKRCEPISVPMCQNIEYNQTSMPNQFNHESQDEAAMEAHQFWALVEINCAPELRFFLCSLYTPICLPTYPEPIRACKSVCTRARLGCENYMKKFGFDWPEHMNCDLFPEYGSTKEVCMDPMDATQSMAKTTLHINTQIKENIKPPGRVEQPASPIRIRKKNSTKSAQVVCPSPFIAIKRNDIRFNQLSTATFRNCVQPCHSVYFNSLQEEFLYYWLLFWALVCLLSSVCTTCTYMIDPHRFKYPEKPIIYLSICYLFVSAGYLMRFIFGHEQMACDNTGAIRYNLNNHNNLPISCTVNFILVYYFGMASSIWWIIVALTWFLAAGLKWGTEAISKYSLYFHLTAWLLPFFQTCLILAMSLVDADSATGLCYVGNLSTQNLRLFVILPAVVYLLVGITFLFAGFIALFRIRRLIRRQHVGDSTKTQKLEKLMLRIGVFSILYTVPATCVIACQMYEQMYRDEWERNAICRRMSYSSRQQECKEYTDGSPEFSVFVMKYLMMLIIGVTSGFWIWTKKTLTSWEAFWRRVFCCRDATSAGGNRSSRRVKKSSVIYFQANDDLENNPHNEFYEASSTGCADENVPFRHNNSASASSGVGSSCKNAESIVSMQFNSTSNTIATSLPYYQGNSGKQQQQGVIFEDQSQMKVYQQHQLVDVYADFAGRSCRQKENVFANYAQIR